MAAPPVTLRRYVLRSEKMEGWAIIVIGSDGYFSSVSDFGNYAYQWTAPGCEFRRFLTGCDKSYFWSKIMLGRSDAYEWDQDQVETNIRMRLDEMASERRITFGQRDGAWAEAEGNIGSEAALVDWANEIGFDFEYWEGISAERAEFQSWAFAEKILPRFQKMLREELEAEDGRQATP